MGELGEVIFEKYRDHIEAVLMRFQASRGARGCEEKELVAVVNWCTQTLGMFDLLEYVISEDVIIDVNENNETTFQMTAAAELVDIPESTIEDTIRRILDGEGPQAA